MSASSSNPAQTLPDQVWETISSDETDEMVVPPSDLPSDEPPLESSLHLQQILLLMSGLNWLWKDRQDYFCAGNLTIYYSPRQLKSELFGGPDFFVVRGTTNQPRKSWLVWSEEGKYPHLIIP